MNALPLVYLVDDDELVLAALARSLRREPVRIVSLRTTAAAKTAIEAEAPALVICDLCLPDGGGERVLREVKGLHPTAGTMVLTGAGPEASETVLSQGLADAAIEKPLNQDELVHLVHLALRLHAETAPRAAGGAR